MLRQVIKIRSPIGKKSIRKGVVHLVTTFNSTCSTRVALLVQLVREKRARLPVPANRGPRPQIEGAAEEPE